MRLFEYTLLHSFQVSIHASVKDATNWTSNISRWDRGFNPRICKRCDSRRRACIIRRLVSIHASVKDATLNQIQIKHHPQSFNPRICKRCDPALTPKKRLNFSFNPRICKRCDKIAFSKCHVIEVSIHASVKDATFHLYEKEYHRQFQSTHL